MATTEAGGGGGDGDDDRDSDSFDGIDWQRLRDFMKPLTTQRRLLDNNLLMELLSRPSFREMINFANLEAEAAL
jgi:hypothetical protein